MNSEIARLRRMEARAALTGSAQRALALRKSGAGYARPDNEPTAGTGPRSNPSAKRKSHVPGGKVGSVSQANKRAQAAKDNRPKST